MHLFKLECPHHPPDLPVCDLIQVLNFLAGRDLTFVVSSPSGHDCKGLVPLFFGVHSAGWDLQSISFGVAFQGVISYLTFWCLPPNL